MNGERAPATAGQFVATVHGFLIGMPSFETRAVEVALFVLQVEAVFYVLVEIRRAKHSPTDGLWL